ncbi:MAG: sigma 54-interacting transcriptional regulator [Planctomycetes bacterium]|nr:sigma 54-interacting transcriptional regulator [Planctomycetota bacterium]
MERFDSILLEVWREVGRHLELHESAPTIARLLAREMPLARLTLRRVDREHNALVSLAVASPQRSLPPVESKRVLGAAELRHALHWCREERVTTRHTGSARDLALHISADITDDLLAAPLMAEGEPAGMVVLQAQEGSRFEPRHMQMLKALREPLTVALANQRRLHEMAALREAAEAERGALLRRLGRSQLTDTIVGEESGLKHVMERIDLVTRSDVPVLIFGETGTGKELVARAIHSRGTRSAGPFMRVNCGAIPPELIDSQLFGHERGSFTGAEQTRAGWFERADGGTLFLDEIGELPLDAQVRFLRVLQDGLVERVGSHQSVHVDVRIVAATHRDLAAMVRDNAFREDLWYRLAVFPILLPPLRERKDDIPALARHFAQRAAVRFGLSPVEPDESDVRLLTGYDWPGNIRELGAVVDRAVILGEGQRLAMATALGLGQHPGAMQARPIRANQSHAAAAATMAIPSLNDAMRTHIESALAQCDGRVEGPRGAAAALGINPHTLRARMRKLKIDWTQFRAERAAS